MKNKILIFGIVFLTLITLASAVQQDDIVYAWSFDDSNVSGSDHLDSVNSVDWQIDGATTGVGELVTGEAFYFDGSNDELNRSSLSELSEANSWTLSIWVNTSETAAGDFRTVIGNYIGAANWFSLAHYNGHFRFRLNDGAAKDVSASGTKGVSHLVLVWDGTNQVIAQNGTNESTGQTGINFNGDKFVAGETNTGNFDLTGQLDDLCIWNRTLTEAEINEVYTNGTSGVGCYQPAGAGGGGGTDNNASFSTISFTPNNPNSTSLIESASNLTTENPGGSNVTISWYINKTLQVHQEFNDTANETEMEMNFSCSTYGCTDGDLINVTYEGTVGNDKTNSSNQVEINDTGNLVLRAYEKISGNKLTSFNISTPQITGTTSGEINLTGIEIGTTSVTMTAINYINSITNTSIPITFGGSTEVNITGFYDANITFNVTHTGGVELTGYTAQVFSFNHSSFEENDSGNPANMGLINGAYSVTINLPGYGLQTENFSVNGNDTVNITLYLTNSFYLQILDEQTRLPINDRNVTIQFISSLEASNYSTENGTLFQDAFIPAEIEIRYNTRDYRERSYYHYLSNQSFNNITLYLLNSSEGSLVIIDNVDESGAEIQGVTLQLLRGYLIGGNEEYEVVEMDLTDFAGEAIISAELNEPLYRIRVYRNITDKEQLFFSNPFEISSTTLRVTLALLGNPVASFNTEQDVSFNPLTYNNETALWSFTYDASLASGVFSEMCLRVDRVADLGIRFHNETCSSSQVATLNVYYNNSRFGSQAKAYMKTNTEYSDKLLTVGSYSWNTIAGSVNNVGMLMGSLIVYTVAVIMSFNPVTMIIGALAAFVATVQIGIIGSAWHVIVTIIILGGILIFKMRT